jgi:hypothetical protein
MALRSLLARALAVITLVLSGPLAPSATVLCLGPEGHVAIESSGNTCCPALAGSHATDNGHRPPVRRSAEPGGCALAHCTDLPLSPSSESSPEATQHQMAHCAPRPAEGSRTLRPTGASTAQDASDSQRLACVTATCLLI